MKKREEIQKVAVENILKHKYNGILDVSPRFGKSKVVIDSIRKLNKNIVIICPYTDIIKSWKEEFVKWDLKNIPKIYTQRSISKIKTSPDILICDEIHTLSDNQILQIKELKPKNILGLSGSISNDTKDKLKKELNLDIIFTFSLDEAIENNIIADYEINLIGCNLNYDDKYILGGSKKNPFMTTEYSSYNYLTKQFNRFKAMSWKNPKLTPLKMAMASKRANLLYTSKTKLNIVKEFLNEIDRCLVFTTLTNIADDLCKYAYHSKSEGDELKLFKQNKIKKLAVAQKVSMGKL